jgi:hypothetical protein
MVKNRVKQINEANIQSRRENRDKYKQNEIKQKRYITSDDIKDATMKLFKMIKDNNESECIEYFNDKIKDGQDTMKYIIPKDLIDPSLINNNDPVITSYKSERLYNDLKYVFISNYKKLEILKCTGHTLLQYACYHGKVELAEQLINYYGVKCNPGYINQNNETALIIACKNNYTNLVLKMLNIYKTNCKISFKSTNYSAIDYIERNNNKELLDVIMKYY